MSIATDGRMIPVFTFGDRLRKAREVTGLGHADFAEQLGVSRNTVTNYERDRVQPRRVVVNAWALRTGVPVEWLLTGNAEAPRPGGPVGAADAECAIKDSNLEPADYAQAASIIEFRRAA